MADSDLFFLYVYFHIIDEYLKIMIVENYVYLNYIFHKLHLELEKTMPVLLVKQKINIKIT